MERRTYRDHSIRQYLLGSWSSRSESSDSAVAAMEARRAKCRRLLAGSHLLGTDTSKLAGVLKRLRTLPEEDKALVLELGSTRKALTHVMEDIMRHTRQLVQVPATRGGTQTLEFLSVFKLWDYLLTQNVAGYTKLLLALPRSRGPARECALRSAPRPARPAQLPRARGMSKDFSSQQRVGRTGRAGGRAKRAFPRRAPQLRSTAENPWDLVLYADEITPGNIAKPDNARKALGIYFTLKDFGASAIAYVGAWLPFCVIRTSKHRAISGGASTIVRALLRSTFITEGGGSRGARCGVLGTVYLRFSNLVCDGDAIHMITQSFASRALLPCIACLNVFQGGADVAYPPHLPTQRGVGGGGGEGRDTQAALCPRMTSSACPATIRTGFSSLRTRTSGRRRTR